MKNKIHVTLGKIGRIEEGKMSLSSEGDNRLSDKNAQQFNSYEELNYSDMNYEKNIESPKRKTK